MSGITEYTIVDIYDYIDKVIKYAMHCPYFSYFQFHILLYSFFSTIMRQRQWLSFVAQGKRISFKVFCYGDL